MDATVLSFLFFLGCFVAVGVMSHRYARADSGDYLVASQSIKPWLVGLSAVATNNSGYMFIGVIGYTYTTGLPAAWLMIGWILGDALISTFVHRKLRETTGRTGQNTFPGVLARWHDTDFRTFRRLAGAVAFLFLGAYAAAQLTAGSKALHVLFDWPLWVGATIGAGIVVAYCFAGGIRASIWTDAAQSFVMIFAMALMLWVCVDDLGGLSSTWQQLQAVSPTYMDLWPRDMGLSDPWGPLLFIIGWLFAGFSVIGQPHIMIRFMSLENASGTNRARIYYYAWFTAFYFAANAVGLLSRLMIPEAEQFDPELALPTLAVDLLPAALVGLILAGVFAATMSTGDSLVLACSAALTEDLMDSQQKLWRVKLATLTVVLMALGIALTGTQSVFALVVASWAALGSAFGPLLMVYVKNYKPREGLAILMMLVGIGTVYAWNAIPVLEQYYAGMAGILMGLATFAVGNALGFAERVQAPVAGPATASAGN